MARPAKLNGYSIKEVASIEVDLKTTNKIVRKLNVLEKEYLVFRSKYRDEIIAEKKKYKAEKEQGIIIDDAPLVAKKENIVIDVERDKKIKEQEFKQLEEDNERLLQSNKLASEVIAELREELKSKDIEIKQLHRDKDSLVKSRESTEKECERRLKQMEEAFDLKLKRKNKSILIELEGHKETIKKAAKTNEIIRAELEKQEAQNIDLVAENGELKRKLDIKKELYQNAKNEVDRLNTTIKGNQNMITNLTINIDEKNEYIKECDEMIKGYQTEIFNLTKGAVEVPDEVGQLSMELAFYKAHAIQYYNELKGAN